MPDEARKGTFFQLYEAIFQTSVNKEIEERLSVVPDLYLQLVFAPNEEAIAFKLGFRESPDTFYSWLGGVVPEHRGQGIAGQLMQQQHDWCRAKGYLYMRTKTLNRWKEMLILNIRHGFDVVGIQAGRDGVPRILLEKKL